jgi:hypothetical protein
MDFLTICNFGEVANEHRSPNAQYTTKKAHKSPADLTLSGLLGFWLLLTFLLLSYEQNYAALFTKGLGDMADSQLPTGLGVFHALRR